MEGQRFCCDVRCDRDAEYELWAVRGEVVHGAGTVSMTARIAGPDPYSDHTDACAEHVGALLGHQPDAVEPELIYWQVHRIPVG